MASILFLCHRLPWPPDKGDKIRSYHVLRYLAARHRVYLGTFIDDAGDWRYVPEVRKVCADVCVRPLTRWRTRRRALAAWTRGEPLTLGPYRDGGLRRWVGRVIAHHRPNVALCFSSGVAPLAPRRGRMRRVMDFVDADSDKWLQYAQAKRGIARAVYRREGRRLRAFERRVAEEFDASLFVSDAEARFFAASAEVQSARVSGIANGVDAAYWDPARAVPRPYPDAARVVVFVGAMNYRANIDAVQWFANSVWPRVLARRSDARFYIVGAHPAREVCGLARHAGISVTGAVDDVRPYVAHAHVVVAPLRIARGIQNKVLEALAMEKVVVATPAAWEGIEDFDGRYGCITDVPEAMVAEVLCWLAAGKPVRVPAARAMVKARYDWTHNLAAYERVVLGGACEASPREAVAVGADR